MPRELSVVVEEDRESEINLTPMLDVVFIMLIFFIVTASFISETGITVNSPETAHPEPHDEANILVVIDKNSDIWIGGRLIDTRAVRANITRLRAENPGGIVVIETANGGGSGMIASARSQCFEQSGADCGARGGDGGG